MVTNTLTDLSEQNWNFKQKELSNSRNTKRKQLTNNTYSNINRNKLKNQSSFKPFPKTPEENFDKQKTVIISKGPKKFSKPPNIDQTFTPLTTPTTYRNNRSADPYGINPLPSIKSPYVSSRDETLPNLESWGIRNPTLLNESVFTNRHSPYLPTYNALTKNPKPYIVVPTLNQPHILNNLIQTDSRYNYISTIPYNRPVFDDPVKLELEKQSIRSDEQVKSTQQILKNLETKTYNENDLFSTKFLDDLEYKPTKETTTKSIPNKKRVRIAPDFDPIAEEYIQSIKQTVYNQYPNVDYNSDLYYIENPIRYNRQAIDIAENLYQNEINNLVRQLAEKTIVEERNYKRTFERPIYENVFDKTLNEEINKIAKEVLDEHQRQVKFLQSHEIKKAAKEKIVNNLMLDQMLEKVAQHNRFVAENDDVSKLLDSMMLEVLLNTHIDVKKVKDKTLNNYPLQKFHLNSFMNVTLDILVAELSGSLETDMRELDEIEKRS